MLGSVDKVDMHVVLDILRNSEDKELQELAKEVLGEYLYQAMKKVKEEG